MRALIALAVFAFAGVSNAATLYLTEFKEQPPVTYQAAFLPAVAEQTVAVGGGSLQSSAFAWNTVLIRVQCDVICNIVVGANPTATTSSLRLTPGPPEYFFVHAGDKIAVIAGL